MTYLITAIIWGAVAYKKQSAHTNDKTSIYTATAINAIFWPICMIVALVKFFKK